MKLKVGKDTYKEKPAPDNFQNKKRMISHDYHQMNLLQAVPLGNKIFGYVHWVLILFIWYLFYYLFKVIEKKNKNCNLLRKFSNVHMTLALINAM